MQDRPFAILVVLHFGLMMSILSSLRSLGCSVLMKKVGRLGMGVARRSCNEQDTPPTNVGSSTIL